MALRFACIGIDHGHIFDHIDGLLSAGAEFVAFDPATTVQPIADHIAKRFPDAARRPAEAILEDASIDIVCNAAIPSDRAAIAMRAMKAGKDVMVDKPGATTFEQLAELEACQAETGRIFSICFSERLCVRSAEKATQLVEAGAIGTVVQTLGMGPHRLNRPTRPDWFFDPGRFGGIIVDIASHQIDQFLHYTGSTAGEVVASTVGNYAMPDVPAFQDFGQVMLKSDRATGYIRVDWFTPDGLPTWGDGRLTILGTEGTIELRKYVDIGGREGGDHLVLVDGKGMRHIDCSGEALSYFDRFCDDVRERGETAMRQAHVFETTRLSLEAQRRAEMLGRPAGA